MSGEITERAHIFRTFVLRLGSCLVCMDKMIIYFHLLEKLLSFSDTDRFDSHYSACCSFVAENI